MNKRFKSELLLGLVAFSWGCAYILIDICLGELPTFGVNALRFSLAFLVMLIFIIPTIRKVSKNTIKYALITAVVLFFAYLGATLGVKYTSLSNAGFMCCISVVLTPIFAFIFKRQKIFNLKFIIVIILCLVGVAMLTLKEGFHMAAGDLFSLMCSVGYAIDFLLVETAVSKPDVDPKHLCTFQLGFMAMMFLILAIIRGDQVVPHMPATWISAIVLAVFCTSLTFLLQAVAQQYTTASRAGVILALEPVFSAIVAFIFAGEILTVKAYIGAAMMLASLVIMEIDFDAVRKSKNKSEKS